MENLFDFDDLFEDRLGLREEPYRRVNIKRDLPKRIATVLDAERASELFIQFVRGEISEPEFDASLEDCVVEYGMAKEEIEQYFPPDPRHKDKLSFNRTSLIASIIWEEKELVGRNRRPGNVRHFWYTNLMYTLMKVMGDTNIPSIDCTYGKMLADLVRYEGFRYSDLNLTSNKSELCEALFKDSPYPNVIIACEKESYHDHLKRLANIFRITFISLGGQGSYKVYEDLVVEFINAGIDINKEFHIFTISDFDPQGYCIQDTAKEHLERAGIRKVTIHRVYLCPEHITKGIVDRHAVPYIWRKNTSKGNKGALTLYNKFGTRTGGIYKRGDEWQRFSQNGDGRYDIPVFNASVNGYELYRVELDNFQDEVLLQLLIDALADFIDGSGYYYKKAQEYVDSLFQQRAETFAQNMITERVRTKLRNEYNLSWDLERQISEKSNVMVASLREVFARIEDDYNRRRNDIESEISRLYDELHDMNTLHESIENFRFALEAAKTRNLIELHKEYERTISNQLSLYSAKARERLLRTIIQSLKEEDFPLRNWVDFAEVKNKIFEAARAGAETFEIELSYSHKMALNNNFDDELKERWEESLPSIQLPPVHDEILSLPAQAEKLKAKVKSVTESTFDDLLLRRIEALRSLFDDDTSWRTDDFWEGNTSLDEALEYAGYNINVEEDDDE